MLDDRVAILGDFHLRDTKPRNRIDNYSEKPLIKLEKVLSKYKYVVFTGDFFSSASVSIEYLNYLIIRLSPYRGRIHSIVGNHDSSYRSLNLDKTALGLLANVGIVEVHTESFEVGGVGFDVASVVPQLKLPEQKHVNLIGHFYLEPSRCPKESLKPQDLLAYKNVYLGHEHSPNGSMFLEPQTTIYRLGSFTREDAEDYNLIRDKIYYGVIDSNNVSSIDYIDVEPPDMVFAKEVFNRPPKEVQIDLSNLDELIANLSKKDNRSDMSTRKVLVDIDCPEPCIEFLSVIHEQLGLTF